MNCANHPDRERTAFCQNCGKPLCTECTRMLGNSVFCEPCYAARIATPVSPVYPPPGGPSPGLAALLGFIPGVGAMYNGQYAKGIVHLMVFALLVTLANENGIFGLFIAGWIFYMVIEAHHTAKARRDGTPLPNPFGLNDLSERLGFGKAWPAAAPGATPYTGPEPVPGSAPYGGAAAPDPAGGTQGTPPYGYTYVPPAAWGAPQEGWAGVPPAPGAPVDPSLPQHRGVPTGAIWLIGLGALFLLGNTGLFWIRARYVFPLLLIAFGVWQFVRRMTASGLGLENDGTPAYASRLVSAAYSSIWIVTTGVVWLLDVLDILPWSRSWPLFLIVGGVLMVLRRMSPPAYGPAGFGYPGYPSAAPAPVAPPSASTAIVPASHEPNGQEGHQS